VCVFLEMCFLFLFLSPFEVDYDFRLNAFNWIVSWSISTIMNHFLSSYTFDFFYFLAVVEFELKLHTCWAGALTLGVTTLILFWSSYVQIRAHDFHLVQPWTEILLPTPPAKMGLQVCTTTYDPWFHMISLIFICLN
jgi:hypothetical protein